MRNTLPLTALLIVATATAVAQPGNKPDSPGQSDNTAPIAWERYKHSNTLSFVLPKLPNAQRSYDACNQIATDVYYAYAEGAVYQARIIARTKQSPRPQWCKSSLPSFDDAYFNQQLDHAREASTNAAETSVTIAGVPAFKLTGADSTRLIVNDVAKNKRWVELSITHYENEPPDTERFFNSLQLSESSGKEIGEGAPWTLGDPIAPAPAPADMGPAKPRSANADPATRSLHIDLQNIVSRPRAVYTDAAREARVQGSTRLKVTLLSNGAVGPIVPVTELSHGLTEQAIIAARRIVFLPKRFNKLPSTVVITVEYSFSVY